MSQAENNEVDLMLRSLARRQQNSSLRETASSGNGDNMSTEHLDADELNAYAEGVLPSAARARYTAHLADCDSCRGLIVTLSQSVAASHATLSQEQSHFWRRLTSLFSPAVLRFAVPVLLLTVVIGITLIALRQRGGKEFVAQNEAPAAIPPTTSNNQEQAKAAPGVTAPVATNRPESLPKAEPTIQKYFEDDTKPKLAEEKPPAREMPVVVAKDAAAAPAEPSSMVSGSSVAQSKAAPAPQVMSENGKTDVLDRAEKREDQRQRDEANRVQDIHGPNRAATQQNAAPMNGRGTVGFGAGRTLSKKNAEVESRSVAGRTFLREGNAWIDSAYESSNPLTRVTRGSEQYRALVADEPAIRTIAQELDGVVIVVWKGHTYRIQ